MPIFFTKKFCNRKVEPPPDAIKKMAPTPDTVKKMRPALKDNANTKY